MGDLKPFLTKNLKTFNDINIMDFPLSKLNGNGYQAVYDKKYATEILNVTNSDYLIFTKMVSNCFDPKPLNEKINWGYEIKILNTKTLEQTIAISDKNLTSFASIDFGFTIKKQLTPK